MSEQERPEMAEDGEVFTDGGVSSTTGRAFVTVRAPRRSWQWTPAEARAFAMLLIRTADAAQEDANLIEVMTGPEVGMKQVDPAVAGMVTALRALRDREDRAEEEGS